MFKSKGLFVALMLATSTSFANTNDDINAYQQQGLQHLSSVSHETIDLLRTNSARSTLESKPLIDKVLSLARQNQPLERKVQVAPQAVLFVSFSMPESLLFALADEAAAFNIPVVVNGLVESDFKKTIETFARLNSEAKKQHLNFQGISIDPLWFQQFQIKAVPALVLSERPASCDAQTICANQSFDVVYGNASLKKSLELIRDKGDAASALAQTILSPRHV